MHSLVPGDQWNPSTDSYEGFSTVAYHIPIQCKLSPEWWRGSVGFRCRRSSQRVETHRVLPAVHKKQNTEDQWHKHILSPYRFSCEAEMEFHTCATLTSVTKKRSTTKHRRQITSRSILRRWPVKKKEGYKSDMDVTRPSKHTNWKKKKKRFAFFIGLLDFRLLWFELSDVISH